MRGWFILQGWRTYVCNIYTDKKQKHLISDQAFTILTRMCQSLLLLVKEFREYYPDYPLLPLMYGSEACKHVFGDPSKIMPDFTLLDFFHIVPKIKYMHLTAHQRNIKTPKRSKAGSGYPIEVTKKKDVNLTVLRTWPSDDDLSEALHLAHTEVLAHQMGNCVSHMIWKLFLGAQKH